MRKCVVDVEADGLLDTVTRVWCVVAKDVTTNEIFRFHEGMDNWIEKCKAFLDSCPVLIMHNGIGYDWPMLEKVWGWRYKGKKVDTLLISRLQKPKRKHARGYTGKAGPHSVEAWGHRFGRPKPEHEDWTQFSPEMLHRCEEDVEIQTLAMHYLIKEGKADGWPNAYDLTFELFEILQKQEEYGWLVDKPYMERCVRQLTTWMDRLDSVITPRLPMIRVIDENKVKGEYGYVKKPFLKSGAYSASVASWLADAYPNRLHDGRDITNRIVVGSFSRVSFRPTNINSREEAVNFLLAEGWKPKRWNYKKDERGRFTQERTSPKLDQSDPFNGVEGKVGQALAKRIQVRHRRSNIEGWLRSIRPDGRIAGCVSGIAATGRMTHKGIVNVPGGDAFYGKQMRKCFTSGDGFALVSADAKSCQDRMLAQRAEVQAFTDMLLHGDKKLGTDGHSLAMKAVNKVLDKLGLPLITRKKGKNFNFGWKFGASDNKLGEMCGRGSAEGAQIRESLRETFPAQAALVDKLTAEWRSNAKRRANSWGKIEYYNGWIKGLDGRPIYIESEHMILVYMLQSDEAIYMSTVYCLAYRRLMERFKWGTDFGIVCFYHDELTIEIKEEYAQEAAHIIEGAFDDVSIQFEMNHCPQAGEAEIGKNWLEVH